MNIKDNKKMLWISKINMALSVFLLAFASFWILKNIYERKPYYEPLPSVLLGLTLLAGAYINIKRFKAESEGKTIADERSRRVVEKAGFFAFFLLLACLIVSGLANSIFNLRLEYTSTVNVILVACVFSWILLAYYLDKKGDA